eukprot:CAMPEP_0171936528 /NCGR_PEP_ID=MMETSP0993-20121228/33896_1 /TAXON_ID=483369 /ORGANISM="non described non described, Strain CCMP2098" /LENGTH=86 /DNA_ID=CAMNT_0012577723 /DNA_START=384 /DNA_END=645 /DNA_ORIENTATION=+
MAGFKAQGRDIVIPGVVELEAAVELTEDTVKDESSEPPHLCPVWLPEKHGPFPALPPLWVGARKVLLLALGRHPACEIRRRLQGWV